MCEEFEDDDSVHTWQNAGQGIVNCETVDYSKFKFCLKCGKVKRE